MGWTYSYHNTSRSYVAPFFEKAYTRMWIHEPFRGFGEKRKKKPRFPVMRPEINVSVNIPKPEKNSECGYEVVEIDGKKVRRVVKCEYCGAPLTRKQIKNEEPCEYCGH